MKKITITITTCLMLAAIFYSCKKSDQESQGTSSLTIVNAISGSGILVPNFNYNNTLKFFKTAAQIPANGASKFPGPTGTVPLLVARLSDTTKSVFKGLINLERGNIYTLFLMGTVTAPDSMLVRDNIPTLKTDSLIAVRFVNLSKGSGPISISLSGETVPLVSGLSYRNVSSFRNLRAMAKMPIDQKYIFRITDDVTGAELKLYVLNNPLTKVFKSITLAFYGIPKTTGTTAQAVMLINNY